MEVERLQDEFIKTLGEGGEISCYFAPGRVNLIGEHTDYNGGHVFSLCTDHRNLGGGTSQKGQKSASFLYEFSRSTS